MTASLSGVWNVQDFTDAGAPLVGGRLYTYVYGTTTQKTAYTDAAGSVAHTYTSDGAGGQYIALNSRGELPAPLYLTTGSYDLLLKRADGSTVWTRRADPATTAADLAASSGAGLVGNGGETVADSFNALQLADYAALRAYTGPRKSVYVTGYLASAAPSGIAGMFVRDDVDTTIADNGGTIIVRADGKRYKRAYSGLIYAAWFGIAVGNTAAANTTGMLALRDWMVSKPDQHYQIVLPRGLIQFTNAKWLHNIRSFAIHGGPTQLQNVSTSSSSTEKIPIWFNEIFLDNAGSPAGYGTEVNGYFINTVSKFSNSVTLSTSGDGSNFTADDWALVYGYNQASNGYPPSIRHFEYRRIKSVASGLVTFYEPLLNEYRSDWADLATNSDKLFGKARLLPLNRAGFKMAEYAELNDLEFMPSVGYVDNGTASSLGGSLYSGGCIEFVGRRLAIPGYYYPTMGGTNKLVDCHVRYTEIDKLIDRVIFENSTIQELDNGPAANFVHLKGGRVIQPIATLNCRDFLAEDVRFSQDTTTLNQIIALAASCHQRSVKLIRPTVDVIDSREETGTLPDQSGATSTTVVLPSTSSAVTDYYKNMQVSIKSGTGIYQIRTITAYNGGTKTATVSAWATQPDSTSVYRLDRVLPLAAASTTVSVTVIAASAPNLITCAFTGVGDTVTRALGIGSLLKSTTTATSIRVSRIYYDGSNTVIEGNWIGGTPAAAEVFSANLVQQVLIDEPIIIMSQDAYRNNTLGSPVDFVASGNNAPAVDDLAVRYANRNRNRVTIPFVFFRDKTGGSSMRINLNGTVVGFEVYVSTAYAGAQSTATIIMTRPSAEGASPSSQTINLKTAGGRRMDVAGTSTALSGDTLQSVPPAFHKQINLQTNNDLSDGPPQGYIVIELG